MNHLRLAFMFTLALPLYDASSAGIVTQEESSPLEVPPLSVGVDALVTPPDGWTVETDGPVTTIRPPAGRLRVALTVISGAMDGADAAAKAWAKIDPGFRYEAKPAQKLPASDGWDAISVVGYDIPPADAQLAQVIAVKHGANWTVLTFNGPTAAMGIYGAQLNALVQSLRPVGFVKEDFGTIAPLKLDAANIAELRDFIDESMTELGIPGVGLALVQDGQVIFEGGLGVRDLDTGLPVDQDTRFMIASNSKGMTTLLLATLVDEGRLDWDRPVTDYLPEFRLGDEATTKKVLVRHLVCACTGLPRKDMQWQFNTSPETPASDTFEQLAATQPTSEFGAVFQYNNLMASAAGYLAAHILYPDMELGAAYDRAMEERIFQPLGMERTTNDILPDGDDNWAHPYDSALDGSTAPIDMAFNATIHPYRPAGGVWSTPHDMARYVLNELTEGNLPQSDRMVSAANLLVRRSHGVERSEGQWYGMGLVDDVSSGVSVIEHGGGLFGYKSNFFVIPSAGVGMVILTNADSGSALTRAVRRRLLEMLYDGKPEAGAIIASYLERNRQSMTDFKSELEYPVSQTTADLLVGTYTNPELGTLVIRYDHGKLSMQTASIWSDAAARRNADGSLSLLTVSPGVGGFEFLMDGDSGARSMSLSDGQHRYEFTEASK